MNMKFCHQGIIRQEYQIEPDVSAACYFYAMAAINGGVAKAAHVHFDSSQGDVKFLRVLEKMGCTVTDEPDGICLRGPEDGILHGVDVVMSDFSDQTMTLAATAVFEKGDTTIHGVAHIRRQESNRMQAIVNELTRLGISCEETEDGLIIHPKTPKCSDENPVVIQTYEDHRMAMAFAVIGTKVPGIRINDPLCCRKTFENYFEWLTKLNLELK
ncbi:MAG: 3-phosphoshikimate 1-carboxyvinyltransferase [Clostridium sp.]